MSLIALFVDVDDFCQSFRAFLDSRRLGTSTGRHGPKCRLSLNEVMTLIIYFEQSHYRTVKMFYTNYVRVHLRDEFPNLVSYTRFVELMPGALYPLCLYLQRRLGEPTGIAFIDSTPLPVCHNRRIRRHKVFADMTARSRTSMGWFYGFKLHLIVDDRGELLTFYLTGGNVDDRKPVPHMTRELWGKLFGDKGYISKDLFDELFERGLELVTGIHKNMQNRLVPLMDKILRRKRAMYIRFEPRGEDDKWLLEEVIVTVNPNTPSEWVFSALLGRACLWMGQTCGKVCFLETTKVGEG